MMRIKGEQMYLFSGELGAELHPIALSTDCALTLNAEAVEVARTSPAVRKFRKGLQSWGIDCSNLTSLVGFDKLAVEVGQPITVAITLLQKEVVAPVYSLLLQGEFAQDACRAPFCGAVGDVYGYYWSAVFSRGDRNSGCDGAV